MNKRINHIIFFLLIVLFCNTVFSQKNEDVKKLENRIEILEGQKTNLDQSYRIKSDELDNRHNNFADEINLKIERAIDNFENKNQIVIFLLILLGIMGIAGFIGIPNYISTQSKLKTEENLNRVLKEYNEILISLIDAQKGEYEQKQKCRIDIIHSIDSDVSYYKKFFKLFGFNDTLIHYSSPEEYKPNSKTDIVFFSNEDSSLNQNVINEICKNLNNNTYIFYYGSARWDDFEFSSRKGIANSRVTLYSRLMELIKAKEIA
jgi:hypothetical protein